MFGFVRRSAGVALVSLAAVVGSAVGAEPLGAQTRLPGIVVESPNPIAEPQSTDQPITSASIPAGTTVIVDDSFVPVTVLPESEVLASTGSNIADALDHKPGIWSSTFAPGASRPIIRGLDNYRVRVQFDGIGSAGVSALSEDHAVPIDPLSVAGVEVVRGPATLRYGSQAIGGVVSVRTNRIPTFVPPKGWMGEIKGGLSSVDHGRDGAMSVTAGTNGFVVHADSFRRIADDYDTPRGKVSNSFVDNKGFGLGMSYVWKDGFLGVSFARFNALYGIPGEESDEQSSIDLEQDRIQIRGEWRLRGTGIEAVRLWLGWTDYAHDEVIHEDDETLVGTRFTNKELEGRVEAQHRPFMTTLGELRGAIGIQFGKSKLHGFAVDEPVDGLIDPAETKSVAGFWFEQLRVSKRLRFQFASRIEQTTVDGDGIVLDPLDPGASPAVSEKRSFTPVSGSVGLLYDLPAGIVVSLTGQYVERAPAAAELFSKGVHEATGTFEVGNPYLTTEKATTAELALRRAKGRFQFDASAYYARYKGFIYKRLDGTECGDTLDSCGVEDELALVQFDQRDATFYGAEISARYDIAPIWRGVWGIDGRYDFVRAKFSDGENVPRIPPHRIGAGIYYKDSELFARAGVLYAFEQDKIGVNEIETPGYTLVSAEVSYTSKLSNAHMLSPAPTFTLGIKGTNLTDDVVLNHASFKRRENVLLPGASVRVFGKISWQ